MTFLPRIRSSSELKVGAVDLTVTTTSQKILK